MKFSDIGSIEDDAVEINITPLVDIVFNLLIFFMVSTTFIQGAGINVNLPGAKNSSTTEKSPEKPLEVVISGNSDIFFVGQKVSLETLLKTLSKAAQESNASLVIKADASSPHGQVVKVMDTAKSAGIQKLLIAVARS